MKNIIIDERISYDKSDKTFSCFDSDMENISNHNAVCLQNSKTGDQRVFIYKNREISNGDIVSWLYVNKEDGLKLRVFNDQRSLIMGIFMFNMEDWTGRSVSVNYNEETGEFRISRIEEHVFYLTKQVDEVEVYDITSPQWPSDYSLGQVFKMGNSSNWTALQYNITRDDENMFVAASKLLCSTI